MAKSAGSIVQGDTQVLSDGGVRERFLVRRWGPVAGKVQARLILNGASKLGLRGGTGDDSQQRHPEQQRHPD